MADLSSIDLKKVFIEYGLHSNLDFEMFVQDELPYIQNPPENWEEICIWAIQLDNITDQEYFRWPILRFLMNRKSNWKGLNNAIVSHLKSCKGFLALSIVAKYLDSLHEKPSQEMLNTFLINYESMNWKKMLCMLDGPTRKIVKLAQKSRVRKGKK